MTPKDLKDQPQIPFNILNWYYELYFPDFSKKKNQKHHTINKESFIISLIPRFIFISAFIVGLNYKLDFLWHVTCLTLLFDAITGIINYHRYKHYLKYKYLEDLIEIPKGRFD